MSRDLSHCEIHGEYMEFGPYYDCPQCRDERERSGSMADRESAEVLSQMKVALKMGELDALRLMEAELERLCPRLDKERTFLWVRRAVAKPIPVTAEVGEAAAKIISKGGYVCDLSKQWLEEVITAALKAQKGVGG